MGMTIDEAIQYFETFRDEIPGLIQEQHARLEDTEDFDQEMQEQIDATNFALSALRGVTRKADDVLKAGKWIYYHKKNKAVCSHCSFERDLDADFGKAVSCPNCGMHMY